MKVVLKCYSSRYVYTNAILSQVSNTASTLFLIVENYLSDVISSQLVIYDDDRNICYPFVNNNSDRVDKLKLASELKMIYSFLLTLARDRLLILTQAKLSFKDTIENVKCSL